MTFEEMRVRLSNRDAIREKQEREERAEEERELEEATRQRRELREVERQAVMERKRQEQQAQIQEQQEEEQHPVAAAADTSSEVTRKMKEKFLKETSKVIVKVLDPYRRDDATSAQIKNVEDFKHLAKKVIINNYSSVER
jgi:hypothetical protein